MSEDGTSGGSGDATIGRLAHRMNNAVAYVVTNLNLLAEELEALGPLESPKRMLQLVDEATDGASRIGDLIREFKVLSWSAGAGPKSELPNEDTWDDDHRPRRILVIDDEPYILAAIRRALRHYDVVTSEGGTRAIELMSAPEAAFDLVVCDLVMGRINGRDIFKWIREHRPELEARLIFMTAGAFTSEVREFLATVNNPVLHKPFDTKTLRWMIAQQLRRNMTPAPTASR
jgi:CheY-like chemotaxis protein